MVLVGARVGAILSLDTHEAKVLGFGVYDGDFKPAVSMFGIQPEKLPETLTNPRITLDNGTVVWGCQCWWGPEGAVKAQIAGRKITNVKITETGEVVPCD